MSSGIKYRGRIAPTPTGYLHLGHLSTFSTAHQRARAAGGVVLYRNEDLDGARCKPEYVDGCFDDLRACGLDWDEGPKMGGAYGPYHQSERLEWFTEVWGLLKECGVIYPCDKSRKDVREALTAPHNDGSEAVFPPFLRPPAVAGMSAVTPGESNWRFRVPDGRVISFFDGRCGDVSYTAGEDFGDFLVWRRDGFPSYEMAVVADDHAMEISEVVRGEDLLMSTARQLLLYEALGWEAPQFYHCKLLCDEEGKRLAKRHKSLSLREIIASGQRPREKLQELGAQS